MSLFEKVVRDNVKESLEEYLSIIEDAIVEKIIDSHVVQAGGLINREECRDIIENVIRRNIEQMDDPNFKNAIEKIIEAFELDISPSLL